MKISVKQISLFGPLLRASFGSCPRKWGFTYLDKLRPDFLPPQLVEGIKFHAVAASLVATGKMPEAGVLQPGVVLTDLDISPEGHYGRMARAAMMHLHDRPWVAEHVGSFPYTTAKGVKCTIDLRPDLASSPLGEPRLNYLVDFKSTSNKKYALKSLEDDVQANIYSAGLMHMGATCVLARWIYVDKKTYAAWPVERLFHKDVTGAWLRKNVDPTIELIHTIRDAGNIEALDLPADIASCDGSGRFCDYASRCFGPVGSHEPRLITLDEITRFKHGE